MLRSSKQDKCWNGVTDATPRFLGRTLGTAAALRLPLLMYMCLAGSCGVEASSLCRVEEHPDGSTSYSHLPSESVLECKVYNWHVNGVVVANEEDFNQSLVHKRQPQNITLTSCHSNVTYRNGCTGNVMECFYKCFKHVSAVEHRDHTGTAVAVPVVVLLLVVFIIIWKWKKVKGWFQVSRGTRSIPPHQSEERRTSADGS